MVDVRLKRLEAEFFKGCRSATYDFTDRTVIEGENGSGKSTVADLWYWIISNYDYRGKSNPNVETIGVEESSPSATAYIDVNGVAHILTRVQRIKRSEPDENGIRKVSTKNEYTLNGVPLAERDLKTRLKEIGIDTELILPLSHPDEFTKKKPAEMRDILFKMATSKSDYEIAAMSPDTADAAAMLQNYSMQEIEAMTKASKKKAVENCASIPAQIEGLEMGKVPDDGLASLESALADKKTALDQLSNTDFSGKKAELAAAITDIMRQTAAMERAASDDLINKKRKAAEATLRIRKELGEKEDSIAGIDRTIADNEYTAGRLSEHLKTLGEEFNRVKGMKFRDLVLPSPLDEKTLTCPTCGQKLPADKVEERKMEYDRSVLATKEAYKKEGKEWQEAKNKRLLELKNEGNETKDKISKLKEESEKLSFMRDNLEYEVNDLKNQCQKAVEDEQSDFTAVLPDEYQMLKARSEQLADELKNIPDYSEKIQSLQSEISVLERQIGAILNNSKIEEQVEALRDKQTEAEQQKADCERIEYQIKLVSRRKNDVLSEEINSHFKLVRFKLFDYQKNGDYKETCIPTIDGKDFGTATNTGKEILGKLDICESLQQFFGLRLPIFLDNAESLNTFNVPEMESQLIMLRVTDDKHLVVRNVA